MNTSIPEHPTVNMGYVPLLDSAPLIIAQEAGFFAEQDVNVSLHRENNWASIRDKLLLGMFDAAHMLAPMVVASHLQPAALDANKTFQTAVALGYNGNAISISNKLCAALQCEQNDLEHILLKLKSYVSTHSGKLVLGTVHSHSMHTYLLHLLLKKADIRADQVDIKVIPPVRMVDAMTEGSVDIFCVGEPWNTAAQIQQAGKILCYGSELWDTAPEKVLAVNHRFAQEHGDTHKKIIKAIIQACQWLEEPDHMAQAALWLASEKYLNCSSDLLIQAMVNQWHSQHRPQNKRKIFFSGHANAPWQNHAKWIQSAMLAFGQAAQDSTFSNQAYDWQTYTQVIDELGLPAINESDAPPASLV